MLSVKGSRLLLCFGALDPKLFARVFYRFEFFRKQIYWEGFVEQEVLTLAFLLDLVNLDYCV